MTPAWSDLSAPERMQMVDTSLDRAPSLWARIPADVREGLVAGFLVFVAAPVVALAIMAVRG